MEVKRPEGVHDTMRWYCENENCNSILYEESFICVDLGSQLRPVIERFFGNEVFRTCKACGLVKEKM